MQQQRQTGQIQGAKLPSTPAQQKNTLGSQHKPIPIDKPTAQRTTPPRPAPTPSPPTRKVSGPSASPSTPSAPCV
jgi:hypothetical protein